MRWLTLILLLVGCASGSPHETRDYYYRNVHSSLAEPRPEVKHHHHWHHHLPQKYKPRNQGWRNYSNVYKHETCRHVRTPINERRWREPIYKPMFRGYDSCGLPIYDQILIAPGGWYKITVGYRCRRCGCRL